MTFHSHIPLMRNLRELLIAFEAESMWRAFRRWWYWQSREGATRRREANALDDVLRLVEPNYRELVRTILERNIVREEGWFVIPGRYRR